MSPSNKSIEVAPQAWRPALPEHPTLAPSPQAPASDRPPAQRSPLLGLVSESPEQRWSSSLKVCMPVSRPSCSSSTGAIPPPCNHCWLLVSCRDRMRRSVLGGTASSRDVCTLTAPEPGWPVPPTALQLYHPHFSGGFCCLH